MPVAKEQQQQPHQADQRDNSRQRQQQQRYSASFLLKICSISGNQSAPPVESTELFVASEIVRLIPHFAWTSRIFPQILMILVVSVSSNTQSHRAQVTVLADAVPSATHLAWNQVRDSSNAASISP